MKLNKCNRLYSNLNRNKLNKEYKRNSNNSESSMKYEIAMNRLFRIKNFNQRLNKERMKKYEKFKKNNKLLEMNKTDKC